MNKPSGQVSLLVNKYLICCQKQCRNGLLNIPFQRQGNGSGSRRRRWITGDSGECRFWWFRAGKNRIGNLNRCAIYLASSKNLKGWIQCALLFIRICSVLLFYWNGPDLWVGIQLLRKDAPAKSRRTQQVLFQRFLNPFDVSPAQTLNLTAQLQIALDSRII